MDEVTIEKEVVKKMELGHLKISRIPEGIKVYFKSELIEEFLCKYSNGRTKEGVAGTWSEGHKGYTGSMGSMAIRTDSRSCHIDLWDRNNLYDTANGYNNFSFIRTVGIKDGVTFEFKGLYLNSEIEKLKYEFSQFLKKFYTDYMKKVDFEIRITSVG